MHPALNSGRVVYDSDLLKLLSVIPSAVTDHLPLERSVICDEAHARRMPGKYEVTLDTSRQVLRLNIPKDKYYEYAFRHEERCETPLYSSFPEADLNASKFAPAAVLALKAKQFDDGLYACVEMAADAGLGRLPAKGT